MPLKEQIEKGKKLCQDTYEKAKPTLQKVEEATKEIVHYITEKAPIVFEKVKEGVKEGSDKIKGYLHKDEPPTTTPSTTPSTTPNPKTETSHPTMQSSTDKETKNKL